MNYDTVIIEMLSRIQALEEKLSELENKIKTKENDGMKNKVSTEDIRVFISEKIEKAGAEGKSSIVLTALDIHKEMELESRYPMVCNAMRQCMKDNDQVLFETESGYSSTLKIQYNCI